MPEYQARQTIGELLDRQGISRRAFIKYCTAMASLMALPPLAGRAMAEQLRAARRPSVIYLSFQECTGCLESLTRSFSPSIENMIFNVISLDYDDTLMAAAGHRAEAARDQAMKANYGKYLVVVDGSVPTADGGIYNCAAGRTAVDILTETAKGAAAIVCVGTCSSFGGIPFADPNPTGARPVSDLIGDKPIINVSGCPPIPEVITGTLLQFVTTGQVPDLDEHRRPKVFFGNTIHDRCYRRPFFDQGKFAKTFDDEGARNGWCLFELGCKGPTTYNACATTKWNGGTSFPIESGHPCLGCSEPGFWDKGSFYAALSTGTFGRAGNLTPRDAAKLGGAAAATGIAVAAGATALARHRRKVRMTDIQTADTQKEE
ncbi:MAG: hydrogenase small subunit [Gammaproteobacteria bacterium]|nr:hydrogenase small subunit [Gammaproteobacteria bacterium]